MNLDKKFLTGINSFAASVLNDLDGNWTERTSITRVVTMGSTKLFFDAQKPSTGTNNGYFYRIVDITTGHVVKNTYKDISTNASSVKRLVIESEYLDLLTGHYRLEFGPHFSSTNVNAVGASVDLILGRQENFQFSSLQGVSDSRTHVTFQYQLCKEIFDTFSNVSIYLVEGSSLKGEGSAIENKIKTYKKGDSPSGYGLLEYPISAIKQGRTYTVCMGIYSSVRQIAGYSFVAQ